MSGAHRRTDGSPVASALKSARWLAALLAAAVAAAALLALLGGVFYVPVAHPAAVPAMFLAVMSIFWIGVAADLARTLRRTSVHSVQGGLDRIENAGWLLCATAALLGVISQQQGWLHGDVSEAMALTCGAFLLAFPAYWFGGQRHLAAVLAARATARQRRS